MNYAIILAAGFGTRIKNLDIPKQYYEINDIPVIIYTIKKFIKLNCFKKIYLTVDTDYKNHMEDIIAKHIKNPESLELVIGGKERIDSIHNVIKVLENEEINENDIIVVHDGVRPFVTDEIILDSIEAAEEYGASVTSSPVNDTILKSEYGDFVDSIPIRRTLFKGQSPDTFNLKKFIEMLNGLNESQKAKVTGTSDICTFYNVPIKMIKGNNLNFKITTDADLKIAELLLKDIDI